MRFTLLLVLGVSILISCNKEEEKETPYCMKECFAPNIIPVFKGFRAEELTNIIVTAYDTTNSQMDKVVSEKIYANADTVIVSGRKTYENVLLLQTEYDYKINLPLANRTFIIKPRIEHKSQSLPCVGSWHCYNNIIETTIDGTATSTSLISEGFYTMSLTK